MEIKTPKSTKTIKEIVMPEAEEIKKRKSDKFQSLANDRMDKAIRILRRIANLSNKNAYEYDEKQVRKMVRTLRSEVKVIQEKFDNAGGSRRQKKLFKL